MLLFHTLVNTQISSLIINVPHMFGIKKKCNCFVKRSMEEQRQQNERQKEEQQPVGAAGHIVRRREIPLWGWLAVIGYMLLVDNFMPSGYGGWALVAGWFVASAMCVVNYRSCGRYHCKITGLGFFGLGILAVLDTLGVINTAAWIIWTALFAVLAVGFGLEYRYNSKSGSRYVVACYSKRESPPQ
jgi:hypothetical protein